MQEGVAALHLPVEGSAEKDVTPTAADIIMQNRQSNVPEDIHHHQPLLEAQVLLLYRLLGRFIN